MINYTHCRRKRLLLISPGLLHHKLHGNGEFPLYNVSLHSRGSFGQTQMEPCYCFGGGQYLKSIGKIEVHVYLYARTTVHVWTSKKWQAGCVPSNFDCIFIVDNTVATKGETWSPENSQLFSKGLQFIQIHESFISKHKQASLLKYQFAGCIATVSEFHVGHFKCTVIRIYKTTVGINKIRSLYTGGLCI